MFSVKPKFARFEVGFNIFYSDPSPLELFCNGTRCVRPSEGIQYEIPFVREQLDEKLWQCGWEPRRMNFHCLNPIHRVGGHKAHVFESVLGLTIAHAEALQQRLWAVARTGEAVLGMQNAYGQRYIVDFEMTTTVGTAVVRSTWIVLVREEVPRLTSCYVL